MSSRSPEDNFSFIKTFLEEDCHIFQEQLKSEITSFKDRMASLEKVQHLIKTLREIEQAERYQMEIKRYQTEAERYQMEIERCQAEAERDFRRLGTEQTLVKSDRYSLEERSFHNIKGKILILGATMGTGSIVASSYAPSNKSLQLPFSKSVIQPVFATLLLSILAATLAGLSTAGLLRFMTHFRRLRMSKLNKNGSLGKLG